MSSTPRTADQHVRRIVEVLTKEFDGQLSADEVATVVEQTYGLLRTNSRVESFVPILATRQARARLDIEAERQRPSQG